MKASKRPQAGTKREVLAVAVLREPIFSPGMVEKDASILRSAAARLASARGAPCAVLSVGELAALPGRPDLVLSMAEGDDALEALAALEAKGTVVLNATAAVRATRRAALLDLAQPRGPLVEGVLVQTDDGDRIPASLLATGSAWVKRADYHALGAGDVVRADAKDVKAALRAMHARGISHAVVQPHLAGEVVKFYGVLAPGSEAAFFRSFPLDGPGKDVARVSEPELVSRALAAARGAGLAVFGGDAVLAPGEAPVLIDLNAWPSFWRCREDAAQAIARLALARIEAIAAQPLRPSRRITAGGAGGAEPPRAARSA